MASPPERFRGISDPNLASPETPVGVSANAFAFPGTPTGLLRANESSLARNPVSYILGQLRPPASFSRSAASASSVASVPVATGSSRLLAEAVVAPPPPVEDAVVAAAESDE